MVHVRRWLALALAAMLLVSVGGAALAEDKPWLPDPCTALNVDGVYNLTKTEANGVTYDFYTYDFNATYDEVGKAIVVYTEAIRELGFNPQRLKLDGGQVFYMMYTRDGCDGAELAVFVGGDLAGVLKGDVGIWRVVFCVPTCYSFTPGVGAPGVLNGGTRCPGCHGTGHCMGCSGTGRVNYGAGYEVCIICDGSGICDICSGTGST